MHNQSTPEKSSFDIFNGFSQNEGETTEKSSENGKTCLHKL